MTQLFSVVNLIKSVFIGLQLMSHTIMATVLEVHMTYNSWIIEFLLVKVNYQTRYVLLLEDGKSNDTTGKTTVLYSNFIPYDLV